MRAFDWLELMRLKLAHLQAKEMLEFLNEKHPDREPPKRGNDDGNKRT